MKMKLRKIVSLWVAAIMLIALMPMGVMAEGSTPAVTYNNYNILTDDLKDVEDALAGIATVTKAAPATEGDKGIVTIKLTSDVFGRIRFDMDSSKGYDGKGIFIIDLNGYTIDAGDNAVGAQDEALCFDHSFRGTVTITGEGKLKRGRNNVIFKSSSTLYFKVAEGKDYFRLIKNGTEDVWGKSTEERFREGYTNFDTEFELKQYNNSNYIVTFDANGGVVAPAYSVTDDNGKLATIPTPTRTNYIFEGWYTATIGGSQITTSTVFESDATIYARWTYVPVSSPYVPRVNVHTVKFEENGGTPVKDMTVYQNKKIATLPTPSKAGYEFAGWYEDEDFITSYDFDKRVTKRFTLYAKWTEGAKAPESADNHNCPAKVFSDVNENLWYHSGLDYVLEKGLMNGVTDTTFAPNNNLTRAMIVTVLYRLEGEPATNRSIPFADVDMGAYYASAVSWAKQNNIVNGVTEIDFAPNNNITREQIASIIFRYAQYKGMDAVTLEDNLHFADSNEISEYAVTAMNWAVGTGIMAGKTETTINPKDKATRAEFATVLQRYINR